MNKITTFLTVAALGAGLNATAQTVLRESFEAGTSLPAGWTQVTKATTGWKINSGDLFSTNGWKIVSRDKYVVVDEWNNNENNDTTSLVSPIFNLTGVTGAKLTFNFYIVNASYGSTGPAERGTVNISTDGGATWTAIDTLAGNPTEWQYAAIDLSAYDNMPNMQLAFTYYDGKGGTNKLVGMALDNIQVAVPTANGVAIEPLSLPIFAGSERMMATNTEIKATVRNTGTAAMTSVKAEYIVDGGTPVSETFSGLNIAPYATTTVKFGTKLATLAAGAHAIEVKLTDVNGAPDPETWDNSLMSDFTAASNTATRAGLIEEFTSSTCAPCASFNTFFDPLITDNKANDASVNFNVIKYQMNWPNPGNDASYNPHGATRRDFYGVTGIPDHYTNGMSGTSGDQAEIDASKEAPAFMNITGTYYVTGDSMWVDFGVTPYFNSNKNLKVHAAIVENDYYNDAATTSQKHYVYVMRRMLPSGSGTSVSNWVDGTANNYSYKVKATIGNNKQGDFNLWTHPKNTNVVVFVQDEVTGTVLQSKVINAQWPTNVAATKNEINNVAVYPNPATEFTTVGFNLNNAAKVSVQVTDITGRVVFTAAEQSFEAGLREVRIPTASMAAGQYNVTVKTNSAVATHSLSVTK